MNGYAKTIFQCTETTPWDRVTRGPVRHHGAREVGQQQNGWPGGDIVTMRCRFCGHEWEVELAQ